MATLNRSRTTTAPRTHEGGAGVPSTALAELRRAVLTCLLWEDTFYEDGVSIAERISDLAGKVPVGEVMTLAIQARNEYKLRHAPLWLALSLLKTPERRALLAMLLPSIIQRADELSEVVAMYWKDGKRPLPAAMKRGLAKAFTKFDAYQLAKYKGDDKAVSLRDVMFLTHPTPDDGEQAATWKKLAEKTLEPPNTWETRLSGGEDKATVWRDLIATNKIGALALLRNLRNMLRDGLTEQEIWSALDTMKTGRVLPFRFISAARYAPTLESALDSAMLRAVSEHPKLEGRTALLIDVSGSMDAQLSERSELTRLDAASALAILLREICTEVHVSTFSYGVVTVSDRRGMALRDAIVQSQPHGGTYLGQAIRALNDKVQYDRLIVITDEQSADAVGAPNAGTKGYMVNVAAYQTGVGHGKWTRISGWSERIVDFIMAIEQEQENQ